MINITEIAKLILEQSGLQDQYNLRYVEGLIMERYELMKYDRLLETFLKEQDEEDEEDVEDEDNDIAIEGDPEDLKDFSDTDGDEIPDVIDDEENEEPAATVDDEDGDSPQSTGKDRGDTQKPPVQPSKQRVDPKINIISKEEARELMSYKGRIFTAIFTKKDGTRRVLNGMTGVRKYTSGGELKYSPSDKGLIPVYDLKIGNGPEGYRMINVNGLLALKMGGKQYKIE